MAMMSDAVPKAGFIHVLHQLCVTVLSEHVACAYLQFGCKRYMIFRFICLQLSSMVHQTFVFIQTVCMPMQDPQYIWVDNSEITGPFLMTIFKDSLIRVLEDIPHILRRIMQTLFPNHPSNSAHTFL